jgi:hypothetical protein
MLEIRYDIPRQNPVAIQSRQTRTLRTVDISFASGFHYRQGSTRQQLAALTF